MNTKEIFVIDLKTKFRTPDELREVSQKLNDYAEALPVARLAEMAFAPSSATGRFRPG